MEKLEMGSTMTTPIAPGTGEEEARSLSYKAHDEWLYGDHRDVWESGRDFGLQARNGRHEWIEENLRAQLVAANAEREGLRETLRFMDARNVALEEERDQLKKLLKVSIDEKVHYRDELEKTDAESDRYKLALEKIADADHRDMLSNVRFTKIDCIAIASAALEPVKVVKE